MANPITTHVLDTSTGQPAAAVPVILERRTEEGWQRVGQGVTKTDGRVSDLSREDAPPGTYRLTFDTAAYFGDKETFYPVVRVVFRFKGEGSHCHVPLLLSPFGYSTYRGS